MEAIYEDFSIWFEPSLESGGNRVTARCRAGEGSSPFHLPDGIEDLSRWLPHLAQEHAESGSDSLSGSRLESGDILFRALFSGLVRQLYDRVSSFPAASKMGLRIKLHFSPDRIPALCNLPWELLYAAETRDFLGLDRLRPIVRYLELVRPTDVARLDGPLRVLVAAANPADSLPLDLEEEGLLVRQALEGPYTRVAMLTHTRLKTLREALLRSSCHILHLMGHGMFDDRTGTGSLLFETEEGGREVVTGKMLAQHLKGCLPRLVIVNACSSGLGASAPGLDFFAGIATSLVVAGVPAVVAMRTPITDESAIAFSGTLFRELAGGAPVDAAVTEGRLAIYRNIPSSSEWAAPVLFMRVPDGRLFAPHEPDERTVKRPAGGGYHRVEGQSRTVIAGSTGPSLRLRAESTTAEDAAIRSWIEINLWPQRNSFAELILPVPVESRLQVCVEVNPPSYLYLVWISSSGAAQPLFPWKPGSWVPPEHEAPRNLLWAPEPDRVQGYGTFSVNTSAGIETVVLLARTDPLPQSAHAELSEILTGFPMHEQAPDQHQAYHFECRRADHCGQERPRLNLDVTRIEDPIEQIRARLRDQLSWRFELIHALGFPTTGRGSP